MVTYRIAAAAALLAAACTTQPTIGGNQATIRVRRGPISPVEMPGVNNSLPVPGAAVSVLHNGVPVAGGTTDSTGLLQLNLGSGTFQARVTSCPGAISLPAPVTFTTPLEVVLIDLECDTGIR